ncbi:hypothetical protein CEUSTIGMA_g6742.t1 [Chlamydomonas eustigma]|uniref:Uncharacterized protein n=1 Tax=Chlamydomonas eustigma TaxID=1157962 RepID=A0A250X893_9CHLO|nr:hypothetical protein CEUSTIGMA_g6742.t1 [Chlamydomonas eustigma]|eukprot:GAX79301.1 hypothetical protein CEUSTIGMA_g6742.t1 [Chlamydomonas eustigma]
MRPRCFIIEVDLISRTPAPVTSANGDAEASCSLEESLKAVLTRPAPCTGGGMQACRDATTDLICTSNDHHGNLVQDKKHTLAATAVGLESYDVAEDALHFDNLGLEDQNLEVEHLMGNPDLLLDLLNLNERVLRAVGGCTASMLTRGSGLRDIRHHQYCLDVAAWKQLLSSTDHPRLLPLLLLDSSQPRCISSSYTSSSYTSSSTFPLETPSIVRVSARFMHSLVPALHNDDSDSEFLSLRSDDCEDGFVLLGGQMKLEAVLCGRRLPFKMSVDRPRPISQNLDRRLNTTEKRLIRGKQLIDDKMMSDNGNSGLRYGLMNDNDVSSSGSGLGACEETMEVVTVSAVLEIDISAEVGVVDVLQQVLDPPAVAGQLCLNVWWDQETSSRRGDVDKGLDKERMVSGRFSGSKEDVNHQMDNMTGGSAASRSYCGTHGRQSLLLCTEQVLLLPPGFQDAAQEISNAFWAAEGHAMGSCGMDLLGDLGVVVEAAFSGRGLHVELSVGDPYSRYMQGAEASEPEASRTASSHAMTAPNTRCLLSSQQLCGKSSSAFPNCAVEKGASRPSTPEQAAGCDVITRSQIPLSSPGAESEGSRILRSGQLDLGGIAPAIELTVEDLMLWAQAAGCIETMGLLRECMSRIEALGLDLDLLLDLSRDGSFTSAAEDSGNAAKQGTQASVDAAEALYEGFALPLECQEAHPSDQQLPGYRRHNLMKDPHSPALPRTDSAAILTSSVVCRAFSGAARSGVEPRTCNALESSMQCTPFPFVTSGCSDEITGGGKAVSSTAGQHTWPFQVVWFALVPVKLFCLATVHVSRNGYDWAFAITYLIWALPYIFITAYHLTMSSSSVRQQSSRPSLPSQLEQDDDNDVHTSPSSTNHFADVSLVSSDRFVADTVSDDASCCVLTESAGSRLSRLLPPLHLTQHVHQLIDALLIYKKLIGSWLARFLSWVLHGNLGLVLHLYRVVVMVFLRSWFPGLIRLTIFEEKVNHTSRLLLRLLLSTVESYDLRASLPMAFLTEMFAWFPCYERWLGSRHAAMRHALFTGAMCGSAQVAMAVMKRWIPPPLNCTASQDHSMRRQKQDLTAEQSKAKLTDYICKLNN